MPLGSRQVCKCSRKESLGTPPFCNLPIFSLVVVVVVRYGGEIRNKKGCVGVDPVGGDGEIVSGEGGAEEVGDEGEGEKCRETEED